MIAGDGRERSAPTTEDITKQTRNLLQLTLMPRSCDIPEADARFSVSLIANLTTSPTQRQLEPMLVKIFPQALIT
jgi:hypothetical protein